MRCEEQLARSDSRASIHPFILSLIPQTWATVMCQIREPQTKPDLTSPSPEGLPTRPARRPI